MSVYEFITSNKHLTLLAECSKLEFDTRNDVFSRHPLTTEEIRILCEDVKVLGPTELRQLVRRALIRIHLLTLPTIMFTHPFSSLNVYMHVYMLYVLYTLYNTYSMYRGFECINMYITAGEMEGEDEKVS